MTQRRWASEAQCLAEMETLVDTSMAMATDYAIAAVKAAEAEAQHKAMRAKRVLTARANGVKSITEAEYAAEADNDVAAAYFLRLTQEANADSLREAMRSIRTNIEAMRTAVASHRTAGQGV